MTARTSRRLLVSAAAAVLVAVSLAGCAGDDGSVAPAADQRTTARAPATASGDPAAEPELGAPVELAYQDQGGRVSCVEHTAPNSVTSMYSPTGKAHGDLVIIGVKAVGNGVKLVGADGVLVTSRPGFGPGSMIGPDWPITKDASLTENTDLSTRRRLDGMQLRDGQRVLPLFAVRVDPGSVLAGLAVTYTDLDHNNEATTVLKVGTKFARGRCPQI
jgi:hypothetical protein